jgi:hypothetical protein
MTFEKVISPVYDEKINSHLNDSEIWKKAYKIEEITDKVRGMHPGWWEYTIQFSNTTPIQCTKIREL